MLASSVKLGADMSVAAGPVVPRPAPLWLLHERLVIRLEDPLAGDAEHTVTNGWREISRAVPLMRLLLNPPDPRRTPRLEGGQARRDRLPSRQNLGEDQRVFHGHRGPLRHVGRGGMGRISDQDRATFHPRLTRHLLDRREVQQLGRGESTQYAAYRLVKLLEQLDQSMEDPVRRISPVRRIDIRVAVQPTLADGDSEEGLAPGQHHGPGRDRWTSFHHHAPAHLPDVTWFRSVEDQPAYGRVDTVGANEHVIVADGAIAQAHASAHGVYVDGFNGGPETNRYSGCLPQELVEVPPMYGDAGARCPPDLVETNVEQEPASVIQDALPWDRTPATLHGFVKPEHPERSDAIGRKEEASADMFLIIGRALDDLGGEPPLPQCPSQRQPGNSAADDQDPWSLVHRFEAALVETGF